MPVAAFRRRDASSATASRRVATSGARQVEAAAVAAGRTRPPDRTSRGSKAISAAPTSGRVDAELRRDDPDLASATPAGRTARARASIRSRARGSSRAFGPPRMTSRGLRTFTRPASPMPSQRPTSSMAASAVASPASASRSTASMPSRPSSGGVARADEQDALADLGLPAADRAAPAGGPVRVHRHVADLAGEAAGAGEQAAVDDQAAADADLARHEQHVVDADGRPAAVLAQDARVRVVQHADRHRDRQRAGEAARRAGRRSSRGWGPSTPGRPSAARCRRPRRRCRRSASRRGRARSAASAARSATTSSTECSPARPVEADVLQRLAAQADDRRRDRVDEDLEAEDHRARRVQPHDRGGAARRPEADRVVAR